MFGSLTAGHTTAADWLFIVALVLFAADAAARLLRRDNAEGALVSLGLAALAVAWLVL